MDDDLHQLLIGLKLKRLLEIMDTELERAEQEAPSYSEFLRRLLSKTASWSTGSAGRSCRSDGRSRPSRGIGSPERTAG
jgi:hypothetical protein